MTERHEKAGPEVLNGCRAVSERLAEYITGDWAGRDRKRLFFAHLRKCPECRRLVAETRRAWDSLETLRPVFCPARLVRRVVERVSPPRAFRPAAGRRLTLLAGAAAAAALLIVLRFLPPAGPEPPPDRAASRVAASPVPPPDIEGTLREYLREAEAVFVALERTGEWRDLIPEIMKKELTGRGNYLKEKLPAGSRELLLVERVHDAFLELLRAGRTEVEAPAVAAAELIEAIRTHRPRRDR